MNDDRPTRRPHSGAGKLLTRCLGLTGGDVLTLFWDEGTTDCAQVIREVAESMQIRVVSRFVSLRTQASFATGEELPVEDQEALQEARGIVACLSQGAAGASYRMELVRLGPTGGKRFGHMPGADLDVLSTAVDMDYERATERCDQLAVAMTLGKRAVLRTYLTTPDGDHEERDLTFDLGGDHRPAITSAGVIELGTWGNIPGGETFIAPIEDKADGAFVLNGSFKNRVLPRGQALLLHFRQGNLVAVEGDPTERARLLDLLDGARQRGDECGTALAELGVGVNPEITELTGVSLLDEKCYGTAHIAVGDNSRYGGLHHSLIHEDFVTRAPSLWIDGHEILKHGELAYQEEDWRVASDTHSGERVISDLSLIGRTELKAYVTPAKGLHVQRVIAAGRVSDYTIPDSKTNGLVAEVYHSLEAFPYRRLVRDLCQQLHRGLHVRPEEVYRAIAILERHSVITVQRANGHGGTEGEL